MAKMPLLRRIPIQIANWSATSIGGGRVFVTVNSIYRNAVATGIQYSVDGGPWTNAITWDGTLPVIFSISGLAQGNRSIRLRPDRGGSQPDTASDPIVVAVPENLDAAVLALFTGGRGGELWDIADVSTLRQQSSGTTLVTGIGQPVGFIAGKRGVSNWAQNGRTVSASLNGIFGVQNLSAEGTVLPGITRTPGTPGEVSWSIYAAAAAAAGEFQIFRARGTGLLYRDASGVLAYWDGGGIVVVDAVSDRLVAEVISNPDGSATVHNVVSGVETSGNSGRRTGLDTDSLAPRIAAGHKVAPISALAVIHGGAPLDSAERLLMRRWVSHRAGLLL